MGKGAHKSPGMLARRKDANQKMAARLKGVVRNTGNCPICHKLIVLPFDPIRHKC